MDASLNHERKPDELVFEARQALSRLLSFSRTWASELIAGILLAVMSVQMLAAATRQSITADEIVMIPAAYYHLVTGNGQYVNEHPPLSKLIAALPLLFIQPAEPSPHQEGQISLSGPQKWEDEAEFWRRNEGSFSTISFWPRVSMIALTIGLGVLIFAFARQLFGARAATIAIALFSIEPTMLAHGRVVQTDIPAAFGMLLFVFALYQYLDRQTSRRAAWLGAATGVAALTKFSMLVLAPLIILATCVILVFPGRLQLSRRTIGLHFAILTIVSLLVINAAYGFNRRPIGIEDQQWFEYAFKAGANLPMRTTRILRYIVPTDFLMGTFFQLAHSQDGHPASIFGQYRRHGWWYYFPAAFALKTTIPFLIFSLGALAWALWRTIRKRERAVMFVLIPLLAFTAFVMTSTINIGVRYYLPAYPFLFILVGAMVATLVQGRRIFAARQVLQISAVVLLFGWGVVEVVRAYPNHMPYMNQLAYGRPHWWYLSDSNVEWGESVPEMAAYLRSRGETKVRAALLGGFMTTRFYGVDYVDLFAPRDTELPATNYVAIGASFLNGSTVPPGAPGSGRETEELRVNFFDQYRHQTPEAIIGNSIYLFRVR